MLHEKDILNFIAELEGKSEAGNFDESLTSVGEDFGAGLEETVEEMTAGHLLPADCSSLRPVKTGAHAKGFPRNPQQNLLRLFKIDNNIFLVIHKNTNPLKIDVKCDPKLAKLLKTRYETIQPSKQLGNQGIELILTGQLPAAEVKDLITHSLYRAQAQNN